MPATTYAGNALLNQLLRGVDFTAPSRVYVSLHTADPGLNGANEVATVDWPAYARQDPSAGDNVEDGFTAPSGKATDNAKEITMPAMNGESAITVTHFAVWDASSAGNCLITGALAEAKTLNPTDEFIIRVGNLYVSAI